MYLAGRPRRRVVRLGRLGDVCVIDPVTQSRVCSSNPAVVNLPPAPTPATALQPHPAQPSVTPHHGKSHGKAKQPGKALPPTTTAPIVAAPVPAPMPIAPAPTPKPVIQIQSPSFSLPQLTNPPAYFGPGTWSYAGKIFGLPGIASGLPANADKSQSYGNWVWNQSLNSWQYGMAITKLARLLGLGDTQVIDPSSLVAIQNQLTQMTPEQIQQQTGIRLSRSGYLKPTRAYAQPYATAQVPGGAAMMPLDYFQPLNYATTVPAVAGTPTCTIDPNTGQCVSALSSALSGLPSWAWYLGIGGGIYWLFFRGRR